VDETIIDEELGQVIKQRIEKAMALRAEGVKLYPNSFRPRISIGQVRAGFDRLSDEQLSGQDHDFIVAGRIMARRDHGKTTFFDVKDHSGQIQAYVHKNHLSPDQFQLFKKLDIGDIIGLKGSLFRTKTGELTINVSELELVTKSLHPLPEKYHEMSQELKYRQRYVDLIMNDRTREVFRIRTKILGLLRRFLDERGFLEVETPMMQPIPGGATARPFDTYHQALDTKLYLRIAPELYLKRLLVGGFDRVYELNRNFRNEGLSKQHNPEFTMLEFYQTYAVYGDLMDLSEELFVFLAREMTGGLTLTYQDRAINLARPWRRLNFLDSLVGMGRAPDEIIQNRAAALKFSREIGAELPDHEVHGKILAKIFDLLVEPQLIDPTFVVGYPIDISPLARRSDDDPRLTDRFELFIAGREIANGFSELNDPLDQKARFLAQVAEREAGDEEAQYMDEDYIKALMYGMPPAAGEGVGVDRVVMLFADAPSIKDVILFPQMRPEQ